LLVIARAKGCSKRPVGRGNVGDRTEAWRGESEGYRSNCVVPELEAVLGKTHRTEFEGGAAGNVGDGWTRNPLRNRKSGERKLPT
jgi:hypothetical protein